MKIISNFKDYYDSVQVGEAVRWIKKGFDSKTSFRGKQR